MRWNGRNFSLSLLPQRDKRKGSRLCCLDSARNVSRSFQYVLQGLGVCSQPTHPPVHGRRCLLRGCRLPLRPTRASNPTRARDPPKKKVPPPRNGRRNDHDNIHPRKIVSLHKNNNNNNQQPYDSRITHPHSLLVFFLQSQDYFVFSMLYLEVSATQAELLERLGTNLDRGWTTEEAAAIRRRDSNNNGKRNNHLNGNVVTPPVNCPGWICCLLPCIKSIPSMKVFRSIRPEDCEVLRNGRWMRYDATALVVGDVVRLETGDAVPADCVVLAIVGEEEDTEQHQPDQEDSASHHHNNKSNKLNLSSSLSVSSGSIDDLLVDHRHITGEDKPRSSGPLPSSSSSSTTKVLATACLEGLTVLAAQPQQLFWGGQVVQGSAICVVTAVGAQTLVSSMIRQGTFPATKQSSSSPAMFVSVTANHNQTETDEEAGISLIGRTTV